MLIYVSGIKVLKINNTIKFPRVIKRFDTYNYKKISLIYNILWETIKYKILNTWNL